MNSGSPAAGELRSTSSSEPPASSRLASLSAAPRTVFFSTDDRGMAAVSSLHGSARTLSRSCPALGRASMSNREGIAGRLVDGRAQPGHEREGYRDEQEAR